MEIVLGLTLFTAPGPAARASVASESAPLSKSVTAPARELSDAFAAVAQHVKPSVVTIYSETTVRVPRFEWPFGGGDNSPFRWFFGSPDDQDQHNGSPRDYQEYKQGGMVSGIIIDKAGHILTNNHVVRNVDKIKIKLSNGSTYDAKVVGTDPNTDLAVIEFQDKPPRDLTPAELGDSDALRVGDWVMAVGAPFQYEQTVTAGIISAKGRTMIEDRADRNKYEDFIQTDAAINPGNSGGPLVNLDGQVIGINSAIYAPAGQFAGIGFAIPINMAKHVLHDLIASGKVTRGCLGLVIQEVSPDLASQFGLDEPKGALVAQINADSPADKAGLKVGDVILRFGDVDIDNTQHLRNLVADTLPGSTEPVVVLRDGKERTFTITVGELTPDKLSEGEEGAPEENAQASSFGLSVEPLTPDKAKQLGYENDHGVLISQVDEDSAAADAGLQPGDLIARVNRARVTTVEEFRDALAGSPHAILLLVKHEGVSHFVMLHAK